MTIVQAAIAVLKQNAVAMTADEIFDEIVAQQLIVFKAAEPRAVLRTQLRRHCEGVQQAMRAQTTFFQITDGKRFSIKQ